MADNTSILYLAKDVRVDRDYKNVVNLSEANFLSGVIQNQNHLVASFDKMSIIGGKDSTTIEVDATYETCIKANYIAFQNPSYSNKWFFAWIDKVEYRADRTQRLHFTVDVWSTWWDYWTATACFVEREHVADDTVGLHTIPEGLETGDYVCNGVERTDICSPYNCHIALVSSVSPKTLEVEGSTMYGQQQGVAYYLCGSYIGDDGRQVLAEMIYRLTSDNKQSAILGVILVPDSLSGYHEETGWDYLITVGGLSYYPFKKIKITSRALPSPQYFNIGKQKTLNGYTPHNKKLLTYPYNYLRGTNNNGSDAIYRYEDFRSTSNASFAIRGVITPGCSIRMQPTNYKGINEANSYGLNYGKLPQLPYSVDMYTNWLSMNSLNVNGYRISTDDISLFGSGAKAMTDIGRSLVGDVGAFTQLGNDFVGIYNSVLQKEAHEKIPPQTSGNINSADINFQNQNGDITLEKMSIKKEYAEIIDQFFTKFGYQVNKIKVPNIVNRPYWNYVKIGQGEKTAFSNGHNNISVPDTVLSQINSICQSGVTIWHQHGNVGNFALENWN